MITVKTPAEIEILRQGGQKLAQILDAVIKKVQPGVSTGELNELAEKLIREAGGYPIFKGYGGYPAGLCTSVNEAVVHGIPDYNQSLKEGDIIGLDIGMIYPRHEGLITDMARTVAVGTTSLEVQKLIEHTKQAFFEALKIIKPGAHVGDIGATIEKFITPKGYGIVRSLSGHGVGYELHEEPNIPNFGKAGTGEKLKVGNVLAIEPMICLGTHEVETLEDDWTAVTIDRQPAAHYENTIVVTETGTEIITKI